MNKSLYIAAVIMLKLVACTSSPTFGEPASPIALSNAQQVRLLARVEKRAIRAELGPGQDEITLRIGDGFVWIVDDQDFHLKRRIEKSRRFLFTPGKGAGLTCWFDRVERKHIVRFADGREVKLPAGKSHWTPVFSPDNKLAVINGSVVPEGGGQRLAGLYDLETGELLRTIEHVVDVGWSRAVFSPNGKLLAVGNRNRFVNLFDVETGKHLRVFGREFTQEFAFSPDNKSLAVCYVHGDLAIWDVASGRMLRSARHDAAELYTLDWNSKGDLLVTGGRKGSIVLWDPKTLRVVKTLMHAQWTGSVRFTRDDTRLIATSGVKYPVNTRVDNHVRLFVWAVDAAAPRPEPTRQWKPIPLAERPNILFAIADDWGYPHASIYGEPVVQTPNFDRIAREGVLFKHAFVSSPSCTASRGAILTGQHFWNLKGAANLWGEFPDEFATYPEKLKRAGYVTGHQGKAWGPGRTQTKGRELAGKRHANFDQFLKERPEKTPFCYWLGTSDPHRPFIKGSGKASGMDLSQINVPPFLPDSEVVRGDIADYFVEVQRFDSLVGNALKSLEEAGELDNTIIVMTSDHGMPFPRCKSNLYDSGVRVPLAIRYGNGFPGGRRIDDLISLIELSDLFLEAGGVIEPLDEEDRRESKRELTGMLRGNKSGFTRRQGVQEVFFGKERHVPAQETPNMGGYPSRAIRTPRYLYIANYKPERWPNGTPNHETAAIPGAWYADTDNGPTKSYMIENKNLDEHHRLAYDLAFSKRPSAELYELRKDPDQLRNVDRDVSYGFVKQYLSGTLRNTVRDSGDPRHNSGVDFDDFPYLGGAPKFEAAKAREK